MDPFLVLKKKDGYWLSVVAPSGKCALIRLEASAEASGPIVLGVLEEVADKNITRLMEDGTRYMEEKNA